MKVALVVPHIFMNQAILPEVIFSPGQLALNLAHALAEKGHKVNLFSPGSVQPHLSSPNITNTIADLSLFKAELEQRQDTYIELLKKHPLTFITLARQVQTELINQAYQQANQGEFDVVHVWCNEEELALVNADFCQVPVVFNHHEPFNFLVKYRAIFPKYPDLNWISFSLAQRETFFNSDNQKPDSVNWVGNVYHGLPVDQYQLQHQPQDYLLYMGRIIQPKGVHYAIACAQELGMKLKIAGKHYASHSKDQYWQQFVKPQLDHDRIEYVGFIKDLAAKQKLLGQARALLMPSVWQEPFGLVMIEAMACGTPVVGFSQGAVSEVVKPSVSGQLAAYQPEEQTIKNGQAMMKKWPQLEQDPTFQANVQGLSRAVEKIKELDRAQCRQYFQQNFSLDQMRIGYEQIYQQLTASK